MTPPPVDLDGLLALAVTAATDAGGLLAVSIGAARVDVGTKSTSTDMVSEMDRAAERRIVDHITSHRPDDAILGEEGEDRPGTSGVRWILDPLDGTTNYLYGIPSYAVSIAAEVDGEVAVGVVHDPSHSELFTAVKGRGALRNGNALSIGTETDLAKALVGTGFGYDPARRSWQAQAVTHLISRVRDVRRFGAAALDLCWISCGRLDLYYERGLNEWDYAAGALIAREAGAVVEASTDLTLAASPVLHDEFAAALADAEMAAGPRPW
ncbi:MAG: inositol monophosphatase family protein [Acidimicrobiales bacterium]